MLEVKWKTKLCKLSLDLRAQNIMKNHWRIGDLTPGLKKWRKKRAQRPALLRRRIYTPNTKSRLERRLHNFNVTNEYGLTKQQIKQIREEQKKREEEIKIEKRRTEDGKILITKKKVLKRYKHTQPDEEVPEEAEEDVEPEEEQEQPEEEHPEELKIEEEAEPTEEEEENKRPETPIRMRRYKPLYPQFQENDGVEDLNLPEEVEKKIDSVHSLEKNQEQKLDQGTLGVIGEEAETQVQKPVLNEDVINTNLNGVNGNGGDKQEVFPEDKVTLN